MCQVLFFGVSAVLNCKKLQFHKLAFLKSKKRCFFKLKISNELKH